MRANSIIRPKLTSYIKNTRVINYDITPVEDAETGRTSYNHERVTVKKTARYGEIVSAIIRSRYNADEEFAVNNNFNIENPEQEDIDEYNEYQSFRVLAKILAKVVLGKYTYQQLEANTVAELDNLISQIETVRGDDIVVSAPYLKADKVNALNEYINGAEGI